MKRDVEGHICQHVQTRYKLSIIVIDKPIGLGGTVYTSASIFGSHLCTIHHQNKKKIETLDSNPFNLVNICIYSLGSLAAMSKIKSIYLSCGLFVLFLTILFLEISLLQMM